MLAEVPTGKEIDKLIGFWDFHPMLMLKRIGSTEAFRAFQGLLFPTVDALKQPLR